VNQTLTNPTNTIQTATYTVTPIGPDCTGATFQLLVTVEPAMNYGTASDASGNTQTICYGSAPSGDMVASGATGSASFGYQWYYQPGSQSNPGGGTSISGWTACTSTQGTGYNSATFTPSGTLTATTSFACFVT